MHVGMSRGPLSPPRKTVVRSIVGDDPFAPAPIGDPPDATIPVYADDESNVIVDEDGTTAVRVEAEQ